MAPDNVQELSKFVAVTSDTSILHVKVTEKIVFVNGMISWLSKRIVFEFFSLCIRLGIVECTCIS